MLVNSEIVDRVEDWHGCQSVKEISDGVWIRRFVWIERERDRVTGLACCSSS